VAGRGEGLTEVWMRFEAQGIGWRSEIGVFGTEELLLLLEKYW